MLAKLWKDDCGAVIATEYLVLASVVVLGSVAGLSTMRDATNNEIEEYNKSVQQIRFVYKPNQKHSNKELVETETDYSLTP